MKRHSDLERLHVIAPERNEHGDEILDLTAKVFSQPAGYYAMRGDVGYHLFEQGCDWAVSRIGVLDERIVTHWAVIDYTMRIGAARVRVGGVSCVVTHPDYRKRGLMRRTGLASMAAMRDAGYDLTMLFGIPDYYDGYGYVNAWPETTYMIKTGDLRAKRDAVRLRPFSGQDLDALTELHNRAYARCTGTAVRSSFPRSHVEPHWTGRFWKESRRPAGYVVTDVRGDTLTCREHAGDPDVVLGVLRGLADETKSRNVRFLTLHAATPLAARLRRENCSVTTEYRRAAHAMIYVLNLRSTLSKLTRELSRRLKRSHLDGWRGSLLIANPREKVTLVINRGSVRVAPPTSAKHAIRGGEAIARLLIGSDEPDEVIDAGGIRTTGDARTLARVLFPNEHPCLCALDCY
jgi:predicted N-acetyltransferase YhbS